jgi:hypothetical protein
MAMNKRRDPGERTALAGKDGKKRTTAARHLWSEIRLGRVCSVCLVAQLRGEFDDSVEFHPRHAS